MPLVKFKIHLRKLITCSKTSQISQCNKKLSQSIILITGSSLSFKYQESKILERKCFYPSVLLVGRISQQINVPFNRKRTLIL